MGLKWQDTRRVVHWDRLIPQIRHQGMSEPPQNYIFRQKIDDIGPKIAKFWRLGWLGFVCFYVMHRSCANDFAV